MASTSGLSKVDSKKALESFVEVVTKALKENDKVSLVGFGTFSANIKKARKGHNPSTNEVIDIPEKKMAKFKPGGSFLEDIK